jgi:tetratricopeptide (TPR) repeat protein
MRRIKLEILLLFFALAFSLNLKASYWYIVTENICLTEMYNSPGNYYSSFKHLFVYDVIYSDYEICYKEKQKIKEAFEKVVKQKYIKYFDGTKGHSFHYESFASGKEKIVSNSFRLLGPFPDDGQKINACNEIGYFTHSTKEVNHGTNGGIILDFNSCETVDMQYTSDVEKYWKKAIEFAGKEDYGNAINSLKSALNYDYCGDWENEINSKIEEYKGKKKIADEQKYNSFVSTGKNCYNAKKYLCAYENLNKAKNIKPLDAATTEIFNKAKKESYFEYVARGDKYFDQKNYQSAKSDYQTAIFVNSSDPSNAKGKITKIEGIEKDIAIKEAKEDYNLMIKQANDADKKGSVQITKGVLWSAVSLGLVGAGGYFALTNLSDKPDKKASLGLAIGGAAAVGLGVVTFLIYGTDNISSGLSNKRYARSKRSEAELLKSKFSFVPSVMPLRYVERTEYSYVITFAIKF